MNKYFTVPTNYFSNQSFTFASIINHHKPW